MAGFRFAKRRLCLPSALWPSAALDLLLSDEQSQPDGSGQALTQSHL